MHNCLTAMQLSVYGMIKKQEPLIDDELWKATRSQQETLPDWMVLYMW